MRRLKSVLIIVALAAVASVGVAGPAQASRGECPAGNVCAWEGPNFTGGIFVQPPLFSIGKFAAFTVDGRFVDARRYDNGRPVDNSISSLWNRTTLFSSYYPAPWWMADLAEGCSVKVAPGAAIPDLARARSPFGTGCANDVASSQLFSDS
jgi:Peptidase inhibitor family I36